MSDLSSLMGVAPYAAAYLMGDKHATDKRTETLRQQELAGMMDIRRGQEQRAQAMHPLELQGKQLTNQKMEQGDIPMLIQQIEEAKLKNQYTQGTQGSKMEADNFANAQKPQEAFQKAMGEIGQELRGRPAHEIEPMFRQALESRGFGKHAEKILERFRGVPPDQVSQKLLEASQRQLTETPAYKTQELQNTGRMAEVKERNRGNLQVANINAEARKFAAQQKANQKTADIAALVKAGKIPPDRLPAAFREAAASETDPDVQAALMTKAAQAEMFVYNKAKVAKDGSPDVGAIGGLPTNQVTPVYTPGAKPPAAKQPTNSQDRVRVKNSKGEVGTIPASQLEAAKAAGYVQVN